MKKIILFLSFSLIMMSCSSSSSDSNPSSAYKGNWTGLYTGEKDHGTFNITINAEGKVSGHADSTVYGDSYELTGTVSSNGNIVSTFGTSSIGGQFVGTLSGASASGTWVNNIPEPDYTGDWSGEKQN